MVEKLLSFNSELFDRQKVVILSLLFIFLLFSYFKPHEKPKYKKEDLQIDINKATKKQLMSIPYIKEKTVEKITKLRNKKGRFYSIDELRNIKNFDKFKIYIKVN